MSEQMKRKPAKTKRKKKKISGKAWFYGIFFSVVIGIVCAIAGYLLIIFNGERILAEHGEKLNFGEASIIYDRNGTEISRLYDVLENREVAEYSEIPEIVRNAFVATEDQRFYEHSGLDFIAIGRAVVKDIIHRSKVEGGSTITQQLAKNVFLNADKTFFRKATEASIAVALEQQMSKDQILTMYLNRIYYGKGIHGIKAAAEYYFDTELENLELWQAATLAAMPKAPNRYNPINNPEASKQRRSVVLKLMYDQGYISEEEANKAKEVEYVQPEIQAKYSTTQFQAFIDFVVEEAVEMTGLTEEELRVGGYNIYTTLDSNAQKIMDDQFANAENFEESIDDELAQAAMVIMDHASGEIMAMSGGRDYVKKGWNRVVQPRQPGSAFKPLISFGPALETGNYSPTTTLKNDKKCFGNYCPKDKWGATPVSMQQALADSRNLAAVWLLNEVGIKNATKFAANLGIELTADDQNLSIALGGLTKGVTPLQMATAYSIIANDGISVDPHTITRIEGKNYKREYTAPKAERLMKSSTARYLTEMMRTVVESGTAKRAQIDRSVAGKTGTAQHGIPGHKGTENRDVWFVGYSAEWTAAVWMGYDKTDKDHVLKKGSGQAAALFAKVMKPALNGIPKKSFDPVQQEEPVLPELSVTDLTATYNENDGMVLLQWNADYEGDLSFEIFRKEQDNGSFVHFGETDSKQELVDMSVFPGLQYEYYVVAYDMELGIESTPSNTVTVNIPEGEIAVPEIPMDDIDPDVTDDDEEWGVPPIDGEIDQTPPPETPPPFVPELPLDPTPDGDGEQQDEDIVAPPTNDEFGEEESFQQ